MNKAQYFLAIATVALFIHAPCYSLRPKTLISEEKNSMYDIKALMRLEVIASYQLHHTNYNNNLLMFYSSSIQQRDLIISPLVISKNNHTNVTTGMQVFM